MSSISTDMKQRGTFSIITLILLALRQKPLRKTRLMQEVMLSYNRIGYYCDLLVRQGLIGYGPSNHTYAITPKGAEVLRLAEELAQYLEPLDQMIKKYGSYMQCSDNYLQEYRNSSNSAKPAMPNVH